VEVILPANMLYRGVQLLRNSAGRYAAASAQDLAPSLKGKAIAALPVSKALYGSVTVFPAAKRLGSRGWVLTAQSRRLQ
jgi:hypothetical protein